MAISKTGLFLIGVYTLLASIAVVPSQADIDFNPTGSPVGGGAGYQNMVSANQADYTVASKSELLNALASAISGQVIYVDDAAQVDMSGESSLIIPAGVTLAGGRGQNIGGAISQGGLIYTSQYNTYPLFLAGGTGVRVTGLRLRGPYSERGTVEISRAIDTSYNGLEVDNCELWAWSHVAIYLIHGTDAADKPYIHHNYIHHCQRDGYGYGVVVSHAYATIEANLFDWCRHAIAGSGYADSGYEARYNLVLENANSHSFDMHGRYEVGEPDDVAGDWIWIHHNIFRATHQRAIAIRGVPASWAKIEHNRLLHTDPNFAIAEWVTNVRKDGYTDNFDVWNNQFGVEEHIRGLWHFDEGADTMAKDLSGNDNHGSLVNMDTGTCWVDGKIGKALAFDGINDYVDCGKDTSLDIEDEDNAVTDTVTVSAWVKFDSLTNGAAPLDNNLYRLYYSGGKIYFLYRIAENTYAGDSTWNNWAGIASMTTVQQNKWYYVTGVKSGNTMSLYINGAKERELSCLTGYTADNSQLDNLLMGSGGFNGKLDEVRIYSTALSADSIHQHWLEGQTRGQWLLDEGQGTTAGDSSDNNNNGTLVNMDTNTCWVNGRLGKALAFDGVNDYVNCGSNSSLNITDAITIETWIKFDSFADWVRPLNNNLYQIFHRGGSDHRIFFLYHIVENTRSGDSSWNYWSGVASTTSLQAGQWYHVACVKSGNTMSIYINGVKERELDCLAGYTIDNTQMTNLNLGTGYNYFNGQLDEVRIYSTALSADSIYQHYLEGQTRGQWLLDEGQGTTAGDSSGNNNNGTLVNMDTNTCWVNGRLGKALAFDGVNDYINCGSNSSLNITDAITIETWIKFDSFADWVRPLNNNLYQIFHRGWGHSIYFLYHIVENANPGDSSWTNWAGVGSLTGLQAGQWYHVACVKSGNTMSIYINGVKERELDCLTGYTIDNTQMTNLYMGMGYNYFNGELDEVRIYPVALSAEKIYKNYRLAGQWHLNEGQGSVAKDTSGNSSDGTLVNMNTGTCWVNGKQGKALAFDGLDDYVNCGSGANLNVTDKLTVEAWIKPDTGNDNHAIARKGEYTYSFATDNGKLKLSIGSSSGSGWNTEVEGETTLDSSQWYHVVGTYDKTTGVAEVYINGKWDGNSSAKKREAIKSELSSWLSMGAGYAGSDYFYGTLDDIKVYKGLLSQGEIYSNWLKYK